MSNTKSPNSYSYKIYSGDYPLIVINNSGLPVNQIKLNVIIELHPLFGSYYRFGTDGYNQAQIDVQTKNSDLVYLGHANAVTVCHANELAKIIWVEHLYTSSKVATEQTIADKWLLRSVEIDNYQLKFADTYDVPEQFVKALISKSEILANTGNAQVIEGGFSIISDICFVDSNTESA